MSGNMINTYEVCNPKTKSYFTAYIIRDDVDRGEGGELADLMKECYDPSNIEDFKEAYSHVLGIPVNKLTQLTQSLSP